MFDRNGGLSAGLVGTLDSERRGSTSKGMENLLYLINRNSWNGGTLRFAAAAMASVRPLSSN